MLAVDLLSSEKCPRSPNLEDSKDFFFFKADYKVTIGICSCTITSLLFSF